MFMFQNGIFATFIPELIMVIAYVLCLFAPKVNVENSTAQITPQIVHVSTFEQTQTSTYSFYDFNSQNSQQAVVDKQQVFFCSFIELENDFAELPFNVSCGLSFSQFSRPPPVFLS